LQKIASLPSLLGYSRFCAFQPVTTTRGRD
jgi:hypothetical protein